MCRSQALAVVVIPTAAVVLLLLLLAILLFTTLRLTFHLVLQEEELCGAGRKKGPNRDPERDLRRDHGDRTELRRVAVKGMKQRK